MLSAQGGDNLPEQPNLEIDDSIAVRAALLNLPRPSCSASGKCVVQWYASSPGREEPRTHGTGCLRCWPLWPHASSMAEHDRSPAPEACHCYFSPAYGRFSALNFPSIAGMSSFCSLASLFSLLPSLSPLLSSSHSPARRHSRRRGRPPCARSHRPSAPTRPRCPG